MSLKPQNGDNADAAAPARADGGAVEIDLPARNADARFRQLVESVEDYEIVMLDTLGRVSTWNRGGLHITGYSAAEIIGENFARFYPPEDRASGQPELALREAASRGRFESEGWRVRKDGSRFWASVVITALHDANGRIEGFLRVARDLTDRRRAETELRDRETRLRALVETSADGIIVFNAQGRIDTVNPAAERMFGYRQQDLRGRDVSLLCGAGAKSLLNDPNAMGRQSESIGKRKDGSKFPMDVTLSEMVLAEGRRVTAIVRDITARRKAEEELREALKRLQETQAQLIRTEKLASLGGMVAGIAHEINTPIGVAVTATSAVRAWMQRLRKAQARGQLTVQELDKLLGAVEDAAALALNNVTRAADLVGSFKEVAVDQTSEERRPVKLKHYVDEIFLSLAPTLRKAKHATRVDGPDDLVVDTFPGAIAQILTNFVSNSILHGYPDGRHGNLAVTIRSDGEVTLMTYADDGAGIAAAHLPKIFDPFFTTKRGAGGSGLGLHIVHNLVTQRLGGTIEVESVEGRGAEFRIRLPKRA